MTRHWTLEDDARLATVQPASPYFRLDDAIPGTSQTSQRLRNVIGAVATANMPVLLQGPTGSGKEVAAGAIHQVSRRHGPMVAVNCAAIPAELLESELFGAEKGAYTGADQPRQGLIEQAHEGTLFLDEIGDMPLGLQAKLLRVIETKSVRRLGSGRAVSVDFRLVTATHANLEEMVAQGRFRQDLFFRLAVLPVKIPSLLERRADIPFLVERMVNHVQAEFGFHDQPLLQENAMHALMDHDWPGNIRELRTVLMRAFVLYSGRPVGRDEVKQNLIQFQYPQQSDHHDAPGRQTAEEAENLVESPSDSCGSGCGPIDLRAHLRDIEVGMIRRALEQSFGCVAEAAIKLRLQRTTLVEKMRKHGINRI